MPDTSVNLLDVGLLRWGTGKDGGRGPAQPAGPGAAGGRAADLVEVPAGGVRLDRVPSGGRRELAGPDGWPGVHDHLPVLPLDTAAVPIYPC